MKTDFVKYDHEPRGFIVGFVDIYCDRLGVALDVKTEIPTVGN